MATHAAWMRSAALFAAITIATPSRADELTRDQLIDAMIAHTKDLRWECSGDYSACSNLRSAFPRFTKSGNELLIESLVVVDHRNFPLHRAVMLYRGPDWDERWHDSWEVHFHIEYYDGGIAFPMAVQCQPSSAAQFRCQVNQGSRFERDGGGFRTHKLKWYR